MEWILYIYNILINNPLNLKLRSNEPHTSVILITPLIYLGHLFCCKTCSSSLFVIVINANSRNKMTIV